MKPFPVIIFFVGFSGQASPFLFDRSVSACRPPHKNGVGTLCPDLSLIDLQCFIGSCKAHCRSIRMASCSKEHDRKVFSRPFYCVKWRPQNPGFEI